MNNWTWGDLRTLNGDRLTEEMIKLGKGKRLKFSLTKTSNSEFVIITKEEHDQILYNEAENNRLRMKIETIRNVAQL